MWSCTKVEDMNVKGIARYTFKQDLWNSHTDYIEKDEDGNVVGIWCNYTDDTVLPSSPLPPSTSSYATVTYSGTKPEIKIGGSYKTFTVKFYDYNDSEIPFQYGHWKYTIDGEDVGHMLVIKEPSENQTKIKFTGDDSYIGKVLDVKYEAASGLMSGVQINLIGM